jgi:hypothetical protein
MGDSMDAFYGEKPCWRQVGYRGLVVDWGNAAGWAGSSPASETAAGFGR